MIQQEIEQNQELERIYDYNGDDNPYREMIVNNVEKIVTLVQR